MNLQIYILLELFAGKLPQGLVTTEIKNIEILNHSNFHVKIKIHKISKSEIAKLQ